MTSKSDEVKTDRRGFLKLAGLGGVASGASILAAQPVQAAETVSGVTGAGYSETDHVKAFYKTAKF